MHDVSIMDCRNVKALRRTDKCLVLVIEVDAHGFDMDGNFTTVTRTEEVSLFGLPERVKSALESALNATVLEDAA